MPIENRYAFFGGQVVPIEDAKVSIMTAAFNYGLAIFEGIRGYWDAERERLLLLRLRDHVERFRRNGRMLFMELPYPIEELEGFILHLLREERFREDVYVRPLLYKSACEIGPKVHGNPCDVAIFAVPFGRYLNTAGGIRAVVSSWRRLSDNSVPPRGKINGAYVNSALAKSEAVLNGADEAIFLCENGWVSEGSVANLFLVRDGTLITPPVTADVLEGITRDAMITLAEEAGIPVDERPVHRTELYVADEVFLCGTATEVAPVIEIDHRAVGEGKPGPITRELARQLDGIVRGRIEQHSDWLTPVA
jgi:branched-chain amino acid aminotransferase